ncbi:hypothetical protein Hjap01_03540 [Haloarcula japonica]
MAETQLLADIRLDPLATGRGSKLLRTTRFRGGTDRSTFAI